MPRLPIKVVPGASRLKITRLGDRLKVCVPAAPEKGKANAAVLEALEEFFGAPVELVSGASSPQKIVEVRLPQDRIDAKLRDL